MTSEDSGRAARGKTGLNGGDSAADAASPGGSSPMAGAAQTARDVAGQASQMATDVANDMANRLPGAAATTRDVVGQAQRQIESSSDEMLTAGTMLSLGVALGLLLAGANRLLVAIALIPAAAMGATLVDRRNTGRS